MYVLSGPYFLGQISSKVRKRIDGGIWSHEILDYRPKLSSTIPPANAATEHVRIGDEGGVQVRFNQNIGQAVSVRCRWH